MKTTLLSLGLIVVMSISVNAQKKSELLAEINTLKTQLDSVNNKVAEAERNEKANKTLMKNLNSFSQLSSQNSTNMNKAMESLNAKERQLKSISDAIASNDSTALVVPMQNRL